MAMTDKRPRSARPTAPMSAPQPEIRISEPWPGSGFHRGYTYHTDSASRGSPREGVRHLC
jgi:hypothetical protein